MGGKMGWNKMTGGKVVGDKVGEDKAMKNKMREEKASGDNTWEARWWLTTNDGRFVRHMQGKQPETRLEAPKLGNKRRNTKLGGK